jgi:hypothetical protein
VGVGKLLQLDCFPIASLYALDGLVQTREIYDDY